MFFLFISKSQNTQLLNPYAADDFEFTSGSDHDVTFMRSELRGVELASAILIALQNLVCTVGGQFIADLNHRPLIRIITHRS